MTFEQIMLGRFTLIGAQRSLANRTLRFEGNELVVKDRADRDALLLLNRAIEALDRELTVKNCRRNRRRSAA